MPLAFIRATFRSCRMVGEMVNIDKDTFIKLLNISILQTLCQDFSNANFESEFVKYLGENCYFSKKLLLVLKPKIGMILRQKANQCTTPTPLIFTGNTPEDAVDRRQRNV